MDDRLVVTRDAGRQQLKKSARLSSPTNLIARSSPPASQPDRQIDDLKWAVPSIVNERESALESSPNPSPTRSFTDYLEPADQTRYEHLTGVSISNKCFSPLRDQITANNFLRLLNVPSPTLPRHHLVNTAGRWFFTSFEVTRNETRKGIHPKRINGT